MVNSRHPEGTLLHPLAVLAGDAIVRVDQPFGGNTAQAYDDLWPDQGNLIAQIADAGVLLRFQWIPVMGRAALDNVGNIAVRLPAQVVTSCSHHINSPNNDGNPA